MVKNEGDNHSSRWVEKKSSSRLQIARRTLLERVEVFETVSGLDLSPMQARLQNGNGQTNGKPTKCRTNIGYYRIFILG